VSAYTQCRAYTWVQKWCLLPLASGGEIRSRDASERRSYIIAQLIGLLARSQVIRVTSRYPRSSRMRAPWSGHRFNAPRLVRATTHVHVRRKNERTGSAFCRSNWAVMRFGAAAAVRHVLEVATAAHIRLLHGCPNSLALEWINWKRRSLALGRKTKKIEERADKISCLTQKTVSFVSELLISRFLSRVHD